ncbi:MAG: GNAT family protein [Chthoniobacteraceae bacterium]
MSSPRLQYRRLRANDVSALCCYRSLPEVARYQGWESFGPDDAARLIDSQREAELGMPGTWFQLALIKQDTGELIGDCGLHCPPDDTRQIEMGITLSPDHQGKGYASEAIGCLLAHLFDTRRIHRVFALTDAENTAVASLFKRLGFRQEAHLVEHGWFKGRWQSEYVFAQLRREWQTRSTADC